MLCFLHTLYSSERLFLFFCLYIPISIREPTDPGISHTLDHAEITTEKSSDATLLELVRGICVGHRSEQLGNMHMFLQYDRKSDRMILKKAKYVNAKEARKEWNEWDEWKEALE